ncbi:TPA: hypothetical protein PPN70_001683 [Serratia rubidaea]|uniref:hypothetical protein n=1 Tax=Serratia rubidaea TaxID=61652 RepID=UPI0023AEFCC2|nr:hypothetical protein [Serratia rubidaea]MDK1705134.1 hypothetical protein [Serratia rubidaea]HDJ1439267.1 hypothetical protein [Serratia rubidaea]HDJ1449804.1 hypothetical protein [Serratia rubidaea]HDJ1460903.1 hypothetical protein [Serratia rubidaea]HDJ2772672.1 hypothetical protein [Serratia rubidaea]
MSKLTGRALLTALLISTGGTALADPSGGSDGGATLNLRARIVESTCAFSFGGANGAMLDFGEWSYVNAGTPTAPKYMLMPVRGKGEIVTNTVFNVSVTADPNCPTLGKMVVIIDGFDIADPSLTRGTKLLKGATSAVLTAPRMNADGSEAATPYYFPYDVSFSFKQDSGDCTGISVTMPVDKGSWIEDPDNIGPSGGFKCASSVSGWVRDQTKSYKPRTASSKKIFVTSGEYSSTYISLGPKGTSTNRFVDKSANARLDMFFAGPTEITTLWGANPPPPGTIFTGQLTLTATYL